jgi:hypothetical protein
MLDVTDKIVSSMTVQKYIEKSVNTKRKAEQDFLLEESVSSEPEDFKYGAQAFKKIKGNTETVTLKSMASSTAKQPLRVNQAPFSIKILCAKEIDEYVPLISRVKIPKIGNGFESILTIRREDFQELPKDVILRLSKDHAVISLRDDNVMQIKNTSTNGVFYLGNLSDPDYGQAIPFKVEKNAVYRLIDGDVIALLLKKDSVKEMLLGFEFHEKKNTNQHGPNSIIPENSE